MFSQFDGAVSRLSMGEGSGRQNMMPTWLEWMRQRDALLQFWALVLYLAGLGLTFRPLVEKFTMRIIAVILLAVSAAMGQNQIGNGGAERTKAVTVMIEAKLGDYSKPGAGIIFGLANDQIYIFTANHLVRKGLSEAEDIKVKFRWLPGQPLSATLLTNYDDTALDLAVIVVDLAKAGRNQAEKLPMDRLGDLLQLNQGTPVWAIGNPNGTAYDVTEGQFSTLEAVRLKYHPLGLFPRLLWWAADRQQRANSGNGCPEPTTQC